MNCVSFWPGSSHASAEPQRFIDNNMWWHIWPLSENIPAPAVWIMHMAIFWFLLHFLTFFCKLLFFFCSHILVFVSWTPPTHLATNCGVPIPEFCESLPSKNTLHTILLSTLQQNYCRKYVRIDSWRLTEGGKKNTFNFLTPLLNSGLVSLINHPK